MKRLSRRPVIAMVAVATLLLVGQVLGDPKPGASAAASASAPIPPTPVRAVAGEPAVGSEQDIARVEDPITLIASGKHWLKHGNAELARKCFTAAIAQHEVNLYGAFATKPWGKALVHELMQEHGEAAELWRGSFDSDVLKAFHALAHFSNHPKRAELLDAAKAHVLDVVARAKAGEQAVIYITKKGKKRFLKVTTQEEAEEKFAAGERLRYAYFDELDLSKRTWPKRVGCQTCVAGTIHAYDAEFQEQLDFKGFVINDFHIGKKWKGKVNNSAFEPASRFNRLYLGHAVFFGKADFDSIELNGRVANLPFATFMGETNFRNAHFQGTAEFRFAHFAKQANFKGTHFDGSAYFAYAHFAGLDLSRVRTKTRPMHFASATFSGPLLVEDAKFPYGITFENSRFEGDVMFRRSDFDMQLNLSRVVTTGNFVFRRNEAKDLLMYGGTVEGTAHFDNNVFLGRSRFSPDELTRREHLTNVDPLHKLYKLYQGDDDAEEDLTSRSQYGVTHVNDLVSRFHGEVSFANSYFKQFVGFERVVFGRENDPGLANFYNAQFGGEAHFERARFYGIADFRTVSGVELSFNQARFHTHWLLDDANVPGRLSTTETDLLGNATVSISGADIRSFGIDSRQLLHDFDEIWKPSGHRLFYEQCLHALDNGDDPTPYLDDPRLLDAKWDAEGEQRLTDQTAIIARAEQLCIGRTIDEFTRLRDSFSNRSMSDESDWAYWHLKHYINHRRAVDGGLWGTVISFIERMVFEKGFGWGVLLANLLVTSMVVVFFFAVMMRLFCGEMEIEWDGEPTLYRELSPFALVIISMHSFLGGFGNAESLVTDSTSTYKALFTAEIMTGIIVITFFIGAYTRLVVSG